MALRDTIMIGWLFLDFYKMEKNTNAKIKLIFNGRFWETEILKIKPNHENRNILNLTSTYITSLLCETKIFT